MMTRCCVDLTTVFNRGKRLWNKQEIVCLFSSKAKKREKELINSPTLHRHTHNDERENETNFYKEDNIDDGNKTSSPVLFLFRAAAAALVVVFIFSVILHERLRCDRERAFNRLAR